MKCLEIWLLWGCGMDLEGLVLWSIGGVWGHIWLMWLFNCFLFFSWMYVDTKGCDLKFLECFECWESYLTGLKVFNFINIQIECSQCSTIIWNRDNVQHSRGIVVNQQWFGNGAQYFWGENNQKSCNTCLNGTKRGFQRPHCSKKL